MAMDNQIHSARRCRHLLQRPLDVHVRAQRRLDTRPDPSRATRPAHGWAIVSWWDSEAELGENTLIGNEHGAGAFSSATIHPMG